MASSYTGSALQGLIKSELLNAVKDEQLRSVARKVRHAWSETPAALHVVWGPPLRRGWPPRLFYLPPDLRQPL